MAKTKSFDITKQMVYQAYKLWNRLSSGSYFPLAVRWVEIPKKKGGIRVLGIPNVADRIAQMVVKTSFEEKVEKHFLADSYGYRSGKSAHDALEVTVKRCWKMDWVLEFDIKGFFTLTMNYCLKQSTNIPNVHGSCSI
jgi:RNA-directed DNA polymerase